MSSPFVAEIRIFAGNFAPRGWAFCFGQLLPLSQNTALFSLLGTMYGGNGKSNFALPDLQGRAPMMWGQGPGLSLHSIGETGGSETVTLLESEIPAHSHALRASAEPGEELAPAPSYAIGKTSEGAMFTGTAPNTMMGWQALAPAGGSLPHNNMMPYLTLNFIIALQGVYPPRG